MVGTEEISVSERAYQAWDQEDWATAGLLLEEAAEAAAGAVDPTGAAAEVAAVLWFDAALAYKFLRDWPRAFELGKKAAAQVERGTGEPAWWNLGIAATALGKWPDAREAWVAFGLDIPPVEFAGDAEVLVNYGLTPIRLDPDGVGEVVWAHRICPTRAVIKSIPMASRRRHGDVILHDGAPHGERVAGGRSYPVFDEIQVLESSGMLTWTVELSSDVAGCDRLDAMLTEYGCGIEAGSNMKPLCACCSGGSVEQHIEVAHDIRRQVYWLAGPEEAVRSVLPQWQEEAAAVRKYANLKLANELVAESVSESVSESA